MTGQPPGEKRAPRTQFRATEYLVDFGAGPVSARIHTNADGTPGGLVADTAEAEDTVHIDRDARVFGNARVFGSVVHGDDTESSDLDILIDPTSETTLMDVAAIQVELEDLLGVPVDVLTPKALPEKFRSRVVMESMPI